jgi:hypothetical protein
MAAAFENPVHDGIGEVMVMKCRTPFTEGGLVGGEDHRASRDVTFVDHMEK